MRRFLFLAFLLTIFIASGVPSQAQPTPPEGMVLIPAGEFWMGTNDTDRSDNNQANNVPLGANDARPRHRASIKAFFLDKTEVTNAQYKKYCDATGYPPPPHWNGGTFPEGQGDFPVTRVNWYEAVAYAAWLGKRLPSEAEWERAARGTEGRLFAWGDSWDADKVVWDTDGPRAVGSKPQGATPEGVLDLTGNVFEWTSSWFDAYPNAPTKQPDFGTKLKVIRGGAWAGGHDLGQGWFRSVNRPQSRIEWVGFRCAKDAS